MTDYGYNTPEWFAISEETSSFIDPPSMQAQADNIRTTPFENQSVGYQSPESQPFSPSFGPDTHSHNNAYTQTPEFSSGFSSGPGPGLSSGSGPTPDPTVSKTVTVRRNKPVPRKGHTKSRRGCYTCKRRKVKCSEKLPECDNCTRIGLICEYPEPPNPSALSRLVTASRHGPRASRRDDATTEAAMVLLTTPYAPISSSPSLMTPTFNLDDLRFFHHFLVAAYPPLPVQADSVWNNVAALSHGVSLSTGPHSVRSDN